MELDIEKITNVGAQIFAALSAALIIWRRIRTRAIEWNESIAHSKAMKEAFGANPAGEVKKLLELLRQAHSEMDVRHSILCRRLNIGIWVCEASTGRCIYANPTLCEMLGMSREDMLGFGWLSAVDPADKKTTWETWTQAVKERRPYREKYHIINEAGRKMVETEGFLVEPEGKVYVGYVVYAEDK